jgi:hypothetical protein
LIIAAEPELAASVAGPVPDPSASSASIEDLVRDIVATARRAADDVRREVEGEAARRAARVRLEAEDAAERTLREAEAQAEALIGEAHARVTAFAAQRTARIAALTDGLIARAEALEGRLDQAVGLRAALDDLVAALALAARAATAEARRPGEAQGGGPGAPGRRAHPRADARM